MAKYYKEKLQRRFSKQVFEKDVHMTMYAYL